MRLALVTGGCRRLGAAIAARLAAEGWALAIHATRDCAPDPPLAEALEAVEWRGFTADLADADAPARLIETVSEHFGRAPDLLVNNAAAFGDDRIETITKTALLDHYAINTAAPALLARALAEQTADDAAIVNILDQRIAHPHGDQLAYTLSKIALAGLTEILARELAPRVRVNAVAPGLTIPIGDYDEARLERARAAMPLARLPDPAEVADAVAWLASARSVTGQILFVDGGAHLRAFERDFVNL